VLSNNEVSLILVQNQEKIVNNLAQRRGQLKIFFGACAGVGKTYAMLSAAVERQRQGVDIVVGVVDVHQQAEALALLSGLELIPLRIVDKGENTQHEFDVDAVLQRKPALVLIDELAHRNVNGSRHPKRFQDVQEIIDAGIDVFTTLNVQDLESLNDIVGQITGLRVGETVPDTVFDQADVVIIVDIPPDELLLRRKEGKVVPEQPSTLSPDDFYRKGNLIALRELALRRTADRVDAQMQDYRTEQSIQKVWQTKERLLVSIGPGPGAEKLIRCAARLASNLKADWVAIYVETPELQRLSSKHRESVFRYLQLAQELGAETSVLSGSDVVDVILVYVRERNISKVVVGQSLGNSLWRLIRPGHTDLLARKARDLDLYIVGREEDEPVLASTVASIGGESSEQAEEQVGFRLQRYIWPILSCALLSLLCSRLYDVFSIFNLSILYLLNVLLVSMLLGRGPGIVSALLSCAAVDFFLMAPRNSFSAATGQDLLTFSVFFGLAWITSNLTNRLRFQVRIATNREKRSDALYSLGKELSAALTSEQIAGIGRLHILDTFRCRCVILLPSMEGQLDFPKAVPGHEVVLQNDFPEVFLKDAQWSFDKNQDAGVGTNSLPNSAAYYIPLKAPMRTRGCLAIVTKRQAAIFSPEQFRLLQTFASQIALALERAHFSEVARDALVRMESERLRNSLLSAVSHDLRTPLTAITGLANNLLQQPGLAEAERQEVAGAIHGEAVRMNGIVANILDMARLQSGNVTINKQWQMLEEVVGSAIRQLRRILDSYRLEIDISPTLPLLYFDAMLLERVLCNLLENAAKYSPNGSTIHIQTEVRSDYLWVSIQDQGEGIPIGMEEKVFDKFTRGHKGTDKIGVGLGLAICKAIVEAHGGQIRASNRNPVGTIVEFSIPMGIAPEILEME